MSADLFRRMFPVPRSLAMHGGGLHISDDSVKYFQFQHHRGTRRIASYGEEVLAPGVVVRGEIQNTDALIEVLRKVRTRGGFSFVCASLPEEQGYLFDLALSRSQTLPVKESVALSLPAHVPLSPAEAVFDCEAVFAESDSTTRALAVTVLPERVATSYGEVLRSAGFFPLSFELESQAAVRAILAGVPRVGANLFIAFDVAKTTLSIVQNGAVRFTTSLENASSSKLQASPQLVEESSLAIVQEPASEEASNTAAAAEVNAADPSARAAAPVGAAIERMRVYWQSKSTDGSRREAIASVILYGAGATLLSLTDQLSRMTGLPALRADLLPALSGTDAEIPAISKDETLRYATVVGLALRAAHLNS